MYIKRILVTLAYTTNSLLAKDEWKTILFLKKGTAYYFAKVLSEKDSSTDNTSLEDGKIHPEFSLSWDKSHFTSFGKAYEGKLGITKLRNVFPENKWCVFQPPKPPAIKNFAKECRFVILSSPFLPPLFLSLPQGQLKQFFREKEGFRSLKFDLFAAKKRLTQLLISYLEASLH
ncbi:hypothetical protein CEXT_238121 [Caerostris extrusa]|uniref:Uncharacterized protein n=1 Tax=Caerostris extrusa TaxID=172846 RepID=A0AAV4RF41_CAEEX|nr:hypothetical protein CEXT_238121 [Caerostris extrusa]